MYFPFVQNEADATDAAELVPTAAGLAARTVAPAARSRESEERDHSHENDDLGQAYPSDLFD